MLIALLVATLAGYSIACLCFGMFLLRLLRAHAHSVFASWASGFLLGQGILANVWVLMALAGQFSPGAVLAVLVGCIGVGASPVLSTLPTFGRQISLLWGDLRRESWGWQVIAFFAGGVYMAGFASLARPLTSDGPAFYLPLAKVIASSQRLGLLRGYDDIMTIGFQGEMHFAALMALGSAEAAQMYAWLAFLPGVVVFLSICAVAGLHRRGQFLALATLFTSSAVFWLAGDGKTDLFAASLGIAAYYWALRAHKQDQSQKRYALSMVGLFAGLAVVAKITYAVCMLPGILLITGLPLVGDWRQYLKRREIRPPTNLLHVGLWMLVALIPHLIKNGVLFGNPLAPLGVSGSEALNFPTFSATTLQRIKLTFPLVLTLGNYWGQYGTHSPLLLAFLPLALFLPKPRSFLSSSLTIITAAAILGIVFWMVFLPGTSYISRYFLATGFMLIPLAARAAEHVSQSRHLQGFNLGVKACIITVLVAVPLNFIKVTLFPLDSALYLAGDYTMCERDGVNCRAMTRLNNEAEPGSRVIVLSYVRYWLRPDLLQCANGNSDRLSIYETTLPPEERWFRFYELGFRYLIVDKQAFGSLLDTYAIANPPRWVRLTPLFAEDQWAVYRFDFDRPEVPLAPICRQVYPPAWDLVLK